MSPLADLSRAPQVVAPSLLGAVVSRTTREGTVSVRLTEVEAYGGVGDDPASHAHRGPTRRNAVMFDRAGLLYVYFVYGMHWCANVVCGAEGTGSAVLLRAGDVIAGASLAEARRPSASRRRDLARGPANLARTLGITGTDNGVDLLDPDSAVRLLAGRRPPADDVRSGPRIGITTEVERPWRWWLEPAESVSRAPRRAADRPR